MGIKDEEELDKLVSEIKQAITNRPSITASILEDGSVLQVYKEGMVDLKDQAQMLKQYILT